jgi:hypothetical protein
MIQMLKKQLQLRFLFLCFILLNCAYFQAQIGMGQWHLIPVNSNPVDISNQEHIIYTAFPNCLLEYDTEEHATSIWSATNGLSDIAISCLLFDENSQALFIAYENGNIDKLKDNTITNIPSLKLALVQGNKRINNIVEHDGFLYLATGIGILKLNPIKNEIADTYYPPSGIDGINDIAFQGDTIYALSNTKLYRALFSNPALSDPSSWIQDNRLPLQTDQIYRNIRSYKTHYIISAEYPGYATDSLYKLTETGSEALIIPSNFPLECHRMNEFNDQLVVNSDGYMLQFDSDLNLTSYSTKLSFAGIMYPIQSIFQDDAIWVADRFHGLVKYYNDWNAQKINFEGIPKKDAFKTAIQKGKIALAGGSMDGVGATYSNAGFYIYEDGKWVLHEKNNTNLWKTEEIYDYVSIAINPNDLDQVAVGTYSNIPLSIMNEGTTIDEVFNSDNSILEKTSLGNNKSLVTDLEYDNNGNLWILNAYSSKPLKLYTKSKEWIEFNTGSSPSNKFTTQLEIDYNSNKWFGVSGAGLIAYNDNGTPTITTDDSYKIINSNDNTGALPSNNVTAIAVDFDNEIWIGTNSGFAILYNSNSVFEAGPGEYNAQRIKLEFEGSVEYLLGNTSISDIEIDGGNRKWIATNNTGIFLLSPDGQEIIETFNTSNSPLISNSIIDLEFDQKTGELYITTDVGLIVYRTDSSYPETNYDDVKVFPNPVHPYYTGPITIQGIKYNSDVKITDASGNVVFQTSSNGGTAVWNGKNPSGIDVTSGVYSIWTTPIDGKGHKVGKVVVIR